MRIKQFIFCLFFSFFVTSDCHGLIINEVYPNPENPDSEWVEIYNDTDHDLDLSDIEIIDLTGKKLDLENNNIPANNYLTTTSVNILNNDGDTVFLKKISGEIIDIATYSGSIDKNKSFCRCPDSNWTMNCSPTKKSNNDSCVTISPTTHVIVSAPPSTLNSLSSTISNIFISEAYIYPKDDEQEWVELYNNNDFSVNLDNWSLDDVSNGGSNPKTFSLTINPNSFAVIDLSSSVFNNDGDEIRLLNSNGEQMDTTAYTSIEKGKSLFKSDPTKNDWCKGSPTKNNPNNSSCDNVLATIIPTSISPMLTNQTALKISPTITKSLIRMINNMKPKIKSFGKQLKFDSSRTILDSSLTGKILGASDVNNNTSGLIKALATSSYFISLLNIAYICHKIITK